MWTTKRLGCQRGASVGACLVSRDEGMKSVEEGCRPAESQGLLVKEAWEEVEDFGPSNFLYKGQYTIDKEGRA